MITVEYSIFKKTLFELFIRFMYDIKPICIAGDLYIVNMIVVTRLLNSMHNKKGKYF